MNRFFAVAFASIFIGAALAGCVGSTDPPGGGTVPGGTVSAPPQAILTASTTTPEVGQVVSFDATRSLDGGVKLGSVEWNFGDGSTGTGVTTTHTYTMPGRYVVSLKVTNDLGVSATNAASLTYLSASPPDVAHADLSAELPPVAIIAASGQVVEPGTLIEFDGLASYGWVANEGFDPEEAVDGANAPAVTDTHDIESYAWEFPGGATASTSTANHTFATPGVYPVKLTVTASNGQTGSAAYTVYVLTPGAPTPGGVKNPDIFTTVTINGPQSLDPGFDYENAGGMIIQNVYETLVYYDRDQIDRFRPVLAREVPTVQNGGISADGKTYTFKLREGVKFHDGTEMDANAVKFSIDRAILMNDPNSAAWISGDILGAGTYMSSRGTADDRKAYLDTNGVEVVDKYTVRIHLEKPTPSFLAKLAYSQASIVSPTAFKAPHAERRAVWGVDTTADGLPPAATAEKPRVTRDPWADTHAVGTGAYKLRAWIPNDRTILDRFDGYWGPQPKMRTVIVQYVDDVNTRILMLLSGDADDAYIPANLVERVQGKAGVRVTEVQSLTVATIFFGQDVKEADNCPKDKVTGVADCQALADPKIREAITHAFDKSKYINDIVVNRATAVPSVIPIGMFGQNTELTPHMQDMTKAKAALAASTHPNGLTNLVMATNNANTVRMATLQLLRQNLAEIGIEATILGLSFPDLISGYQVGKYPVWMIGWAPDYAYPDDYVVPFLDGRSGTYARGGSYNDAEMNSLIDLAVNEPDPAKQLPTWKQIDAKAHADYVHLWLSQAKNTHVERTWVTGYYYNPMDSGQPNFANYAVAGKA